MGRNARQSRSTTHPKNLSRGGRPQSDKSNHPCNLMRVGRRPLHAAIEASNHYWLDGLMRGDRTPDGLADHPRCEGCHLGHDRPHHPVDRIAKEAHSFNIRRDVANDSVSCTGIPRWMGWKVRIAAGEPFVDRARAVVTWCCRRGPEMAKGVELIGMRTSAAATERTCRDEPRRLHRRGPIPSSPSERAGIAMDVLTELIATAVRLHQWSCSLRFRTNSSWNGGGIGSGRSSGLTLPAPGKK
jgi:hypothetical protein